MDRMNKEFLTRNEKVLQRWRKPEMEVLKINVDGAYNSHLGSGGWGYVTRDDTGLVIESGAGKLVHLMDAFHAEVLALRAGVEAAARRGMMRVQFETDSLTLVQGLRSNVYRLAATGGLCVDILQRCVNSFNVFSFYYCPRNCNRVAHALAALGCNSSQTTDVSWDGSPPDVEDLVAGDLAEPMV
uniref:RNase H type-1 domain-containing protein n=1 Tax=Oryza glaberrima TaxID=4538 RepID=I1QUQ1_ORYGL